jgi:hypothetical protein
MTPVILIDASQGIGLLPDDAPGGKDPACC